MRIRLTGLLVLGFLLSLSHGAASSPQEGLAAELAALPKAPGAASETSDGRPPLPKFEDVTKGMKSREGMFTLWFYPPEDKEKDSERLLCQIPGRLLGEKIMLSTSVAGGSFFTGFPLDQRVVQWQLFDRKVLLVEPETTVVSDEKATVSDVVRRTYPERIRAAVPVVTKTPDGDPVIDLGPLLKSDFADISWMSAGPIMIDSTLSKWTTRKSFELNVELGVELALRSMNPPGSFNKHFVHYSFWKLPQSDYQSRPADDRVGYFLTANTDWSKPTGVRELFNRYIDRWHLVKRDPGLALCEPVNPIVFYVEKTVPVRFRRAVRDGILEWNKAFEKLGFVDAIQVRQQTDTNEWKDLDPEDMRYSFFRWIVTGAGFAMGPHRANPYTGQIYDADIIFDDSMVRFFEHEAQRLMPAAIAEMKTADPARRAFFEQMPDWQRPKRDWESFSLKGADERQVRERMRERLQDRGLHLCEYAEGMKHQLAVARTVLAGQPPEVIEAFLYDVIKEVVMHEVGHTLGLRHNFKASSIYSLDEIRRRRGTGEPTVGSVMDYNPALLFKDKPAEGRFITPTIGPYDYWAIEYGYRLAQDAAKTQSPRSSPADEKKPEATLASTKAESEKTAADRIPKEVLDKLPPDIRKKLAEAEAPTNPAKDQPAGSPFSGPNAAELEMLHSIASRASEPELAYATDEDTTFLGADPRTNRFDMGGDPVEWAKSRFELIDDRMGKILEWAVKDKESWYFARDAFISLMLEKIVVQDYVGRFIGGLETSRSHRGDPDEKPPFHVVDAKQQRDALSFIEQNLYRDSFFSFSTEVLNHLAAPRWWHVGMEVDFRVDFPVHQYVSLFQWWNLVDRLDPNVLRRIQDSELKTAEADKLTAAEYLQRVQTAVWSDVMGSNSVAGGDWSDAKPYLSSIRRSLQREYLNLVEPMVRMRPGSALTPDLQAMMQHGLRNLGSQIEAAAKSGKLDFASEAHLTACKSRIDRMLAAELDELRPR